MGNFLSKLVKDTHGIFGEIVLGVSMMITGLATLFVGNYIIFAIVTSLPAISNGGAANGSVASNAYNTTIGTLTTYAETIIPIFGLAFLVAGFALILYTLRVSGGGQSNVVR